MRISQWTTYAQNAEIKLHPDAFHKRKKEPRLTPDTIQEIARKITDEAHFTFTKPNESIRQTFGLEGEQLKSSVRKLQLTTMRDLAEHIKNTKPDFIGLKNEEVCTFRTRHTVFEPKNPIAPHSDYYPQIILGSNTNTQDLNPGEFLANLLFFNLDPQYFSTPIDDLFKEAGVPYIKPELIDTLESYTITGLNPGEGYLAIHSDWLLAHSVDKQNSIAKRRINAADIHVVNKQADIKVVESRKYRKKEAEADRLFIEGKDLYFDYEFFS